MIERQSGTVVNFASDAGRIGTSCEVVYSACKAGIIALCKSLARENSRYNVNFNVVSAGPTDTPLLQEEIRDNPRTDQTHDPAHSVSQSGAAGRPGGGGEFFGVG